MKVDTKFICILFYKINSFRILKEDFVLNLLKDLKMMIIKKERLREVYKGTSISMHTHR